MSGRISFPGRIGAGGRPSNYKRPAARGVRSPGRNDMQAVCAFDPETFEEIRTLAERAGISFRAQVRLLVEFGLEDLKADAAERHNQQMVRRSGDGAPSAALRMAEGAPAGRPTR